MEYLDTPQWNPGGTMCPSQLMPREATKMIFSLKRCGNFLLFSLLVVCVAVASQAAAAENDAEAAAEPSLEMPALWFVGLTSAPVAEARSEEHTSDSSHRCISCAVFCLKKKRQSIFRIMCIVRGGLRTITVCHRT